MFYDLLQADLELNIPEIDDRYWVWPFYDLYANNHCNVGSLQGNPLGKYLLRFTDNNSELQTEQINDTYQGYVNSPTPYGLLLIRIEALNPTTDIDRTMEMNQNVTVTVINRTGDSNVPELDLSIFAAVINSTASLGEKVLNLTAQLSSCNEPEILADRAWVAATLEDAGISGDGQTYTMSDGTNLTAAVATANASAAAVRLQAGFTQNLGNNWTQGAPQVSGDFKSYYNARQYIAQNGYLQLTADQAIYPRYTAGSLSLGPDEAYLFTHLAKPELIETGFWSLTIYGEDQFLIANDLDRSAIGDRNNLTYADGTPVYSGEGHDTDTANQPFQILLQRADLTPPDNWTSNWLPVPAGGGTFSLNFRLYGAQESMTDGSWEYPLVEKIDAVTAEA